MPQESEPQNLTLALEGLTPIVWMEWCATRCSDPRKPTREELWPDAEERLGWQNVLVMADVLVAGASNAKERERRAKSLTCLAKALVTMSLVPGGVRAFGLRLEAVERNGILTLETNRV